MVATVIRRTKANGIVEALAKCQQVHGNGYLSAFPEEFFERLKEGKRVWAPFYTLHKIMTGLLDMYTLCGNSQALDMVKGMAAWTEKWSDPLTDVHMARILDVEYGGMNDVLRSLYAVTGYDSHLNLARRFDHERIFGPLAASRDEP